MNRWVEKYLGSSWLPGTLLILAFVLAAATSLSTENVVLRAVFVVSNSVYALSIPLLFVAGFFQARHGKRMSGVIHIGFGIGLILLFTVLALGA